MRQYLSAKKVRRLAESTGLDVAHASARGGSGHSLHLYVRDDSAAPNRQPTYRLYRDGSVELMDRWFWAKRST